LPRYVEPLVENVTQVRNHRKYLEGDNSAINKHIRQTLSQQNAQSGAYCVAIDAARPGTAYIAYGAGGPESSIYREWFNITPKGGFPVSAEGLSITWDTVALRVVIMVLLLP
jgi:hypothetical protein